MTALATRVMKARRTRGTCPACRTPLITGQQIGKVPGRAWMHVSCIVEANRKASTEGKRP